MQDKDAQIMELFRELPPEKQQDIISLAQSMFLAGPKGSPSDHRSNNG